MKAYCWTRSIDALILNLGASWRLIVNLTPRPLYFQERTPVHIEEEAGWALQPLRASGNREKFLPTTGIQTVDRAVPSSGSRIVQCGSSDKHDETNSRLSQFCDTV